MSTACAAQLQLCDCPCTKSPKLGRLAIIVISYRQLTLIINITISNLIPEMSNIFCQKSKSELKKKKVNKISYFQRLCINLYIFIIDSVIIKLIFCKSKIAGV